MPGAAIGGLVPEVTVAVVAGTVEVVVEVMEAIPVVAEADAADVVVGGCTAELVVVGLPRLENKLPDCEAAVGVNVGVDALLFGAPNPENNVPADGVVLRGALWVGAAMLIAILAAPGQDTPPKPAPTNTALVSWPSPSTGFALQQNTNLNTANWTTAPQTVTDNGTNRFIVVNPPVGNRFYRLVKP